MKSIKHTTSLSVRVSQLFFVHALVFMSAFRDICVSTCFLTDCYFNLCRFSLKNIQSVFLLCSTQYLYYLFAVSSSLLAPHLNSLLKMSPLQILQLQLRGLKTHVITFTVCKQVLSQQLCVEFLLLYSQSLWMEQRQEVNTYT